MSANLNFLSPETATSSLTLAAEVFAQWRAGKVVVLNQDGITVNGTKWKNSNVVPVSNPSCPNGRVLVEAANDAKKHFHKHSNNNGQPLLTGPFRISLERGVLVLPNRTLLPLPPRYFQVLSGMFTKDDVGFSVRQSQLSYQSVAFLFEKGKLEEKRKDKTAQKNELKSAFETIKMNSTKIAQEFRRQFSRWLRSNGIDPKFVIKCVKREEIYRLASGWDPKRPVIDGGEAGLVLNGNAKPQESTNQNTWEDSMRKTPEGVMDAAVNTNNSGQKTPYELLVEQECWETESED